MNRNIDKNIDKNMDRNIGKNIGKNIVNKSISIVFVLLSQLGAVSALASSKSLPVNSHGEKIMFFCQVPVEIGESQVSLELTLGNDLSIDFVTVALNDVEKSILFYTQIEKGELAKDMATGRISYLLLSEDANKSEGVIRNAGYLVIEKDFDGNQTGFFSAEGNIYPLTCITQ